MNKRLFILLISVVFFIGLKGQELSDLKSQKTELLKKIERANKLLLSYDKKKSKNITQIRLYDRQLKDKEKLLNIYKDELNVIDIQIAQLSTDINSNETELKQLKDDYASLIRKAYENKKMYNKISFFLGAESFNDAYRKYVLLLEYNKFRQNQGLLIERKSKQLKIEYQKLDSVRNDKVELLNKVEAERNSYKNAKVKFQSDVAQLKKKESELKRDLKKQQKALKTLEESIIKLIRETSTKSTTFSNFNESKGNLSWPVSKGLVISKYGEHQHPVLKYVKVNNNGIDIKCTNSNDVTAVFKGEVSRVVGIPGYNKAVIIRHGKYLTVYANLSSVYVKVGDVVNQDHKIGLVYKGEGENSGVLHFELWEENKKINPEVWLSK